MSAILKIIGAIIVFMALNTVIQGQFDYEGKIEDKWTLSGGNQVRSITMPYYEVIEEPGVFTYNTQISPIDYDTLIIPQINAYALKVYQDNILIYQLGDFDNPTTNLWNMTHTIQLLPMTKNNMTNIKIETYSLHDIGIKGPVILAVYENVYKKTGIQNFFNQSLIFFLIGGYSAVGLLLILLARTSYQNMKKNDVRTFSFFGLASFFFSIFMVDSMYRTWTFNLTVLFAVRKITYIGLYAGIYFLTLGIRRYMADKETPKWVLALFIIMSALLVFSPTYSIMYFFANINLVIIFVTIFFILKMSIFSNKNPMVFSSTLMAMTAIQSILVDVGIIGGAYLYHYGLFIYMMAFTYIVAYKYGNIEKESLALSKRVVLDALTGAYNRAYLSRLVLHEQDLALFLDLDRFKQFNDSYGHDMGDALLCDLVRIFKKVIGEQLEIIRYGGDEFVVILRDYKKASVDSVMGAIKEQLRQTYPDIDYSYGYLAYDGDLTDTLIQADHEMYKMKKEKHLID